VLPEYRPPNPATYRSTTVLRASCPQFRLLCRHLHHRLPPSCPASWAVALVASRPVVAWCLVAAGVPVVSSGRQDVQRMCCRPPVSSSSALNCLSTCHTRQLERQLESAQGWIAQHRSMNLISTQDTVKLHAIVLMSTITNIYIYISLFATSAEI